MVPVINWWLNNAAFAAECHEVVCLRLMKLAAGGPQAGHEAQRMVSEKMLAAAFAGTQLATGASAERVMRGYRRKVRANSRRLRDS